MYAARGNLDQRAAEAGEEEARQEVRGEEEEEEEESDDEFCDRTTSPVPKWEVLAGKRVEGSLGTVLVPSEGVPFRRGD
jgi:hypothetical protein